MTLILALNNDGGGGGNGGTLEKEAEEPEVPNLRLPIPGGSGQFLLESTNTATRRIVGM